MPTMWLCINLSNKFESFWKFISKKLEMEPMWFCNARSNWFLNLNKCYKCDCAFFGASDLRQHLETHSAVEESQRNVVNVSLHLFQKRVSKSIWKCTAEEVWRNATMKSSYFIFMHSGENQTIAISVRRHYFWAGKFRKHFKMHNGGKSKLLSGW